MKVKTSEKEQVEVVPFYGSATAKRGESNKIENALHTTSISPSVNDKAPEKKTSVTLASDEKSRFIKKKKSKLKPLHTSNVQKNDDKVAIENAAKTTSISEAPKNGQPENKTAVSATSDEERFASKWKKPKRKPLKSFHASETNKNLSHVSAANQDDFTKKMETAEQNLKDAFVEAADVKQKRQQQQSQPPQKKSSLFDNNPPVIVTKTITKTTNFVYEDDEDDSDWLRVLGEIRSETNDDDDEDDLGMVDFAALANDASPF